MQLNPEILKKLLFRCARIFQKQLSNREAIAIFLNNYRLVMELHSAIIASCLSVDLCLHFALLYSQFLLLYLFSEQDRAGKWRRKASSNRPRSMSKLKGWTPCW